MYTKVYIKKNRYEKNKYNFINSYNDFNYVIK